MSATDVSINFRVGGVLEPDQKRNARWFRGLDQRGNGDGFVMLDELPVAAAAPGGAGHLAPAVGESFRARFTKLDVNGTARSSAGAIDPPAAEGRALAQPVSLLLAGVGGREDPEKVIVWTRDGETGDRRKTVAGEHRKPQSPEVRVLLGFLTRARRRPKKGTGVTISIDGEAHKAVLTAGLRRAGPTAA